MYICASRFRFYYLKALPLSALQNKTQPLQSLVFRFSSVLLNASQHIFAVILCLEDLWLYENLKRFRRRA